MNLGIAGRTAVVTCAGEAIGAAAVSLLRSEGAVVLDASRSTGVDVSERDAPARVRSALGGAAPDILVNIAGTGAIRALDQLTDADWQEQWDLNVTGPRRLMHAFAPEMAERGWGRIVNVSSSSGEVPSSSNPACSVARAGQLSLSRAYGETYAARGVLVNAITRRSADGPLHDQEVAAIVAFLCSDPASAVAGATWTVDS
jgi:3-oxoacyl-[acyl-carrier protein] reductase